MCRNNVIHWCDVCVGESGEEVLYGTSDGQIGLIQLSRLCIKKYIYF